MPINYEVAKREGQELNCPQCHLALKVAIDDGAEVDFCERCKGIWVDFIGEKEILDIKPEIFSVDELRRLHKLYKPLGKVDTRGYIPCPICQQLMHRKNWGSYSGVIVDKCEEHGTWYDAGEITKIREYIKLGGIEYEKFNLAQQGLNDLDRKLTRKIYDVDARLDSVYNQARFYTWLFTHRQYM